MHAQEKAGNTSAMVYQTRITSAQSNGLNYATFTNMPVDSAKGTTYWIWALDFNYQGSQITGDTSITLSAPCNTCRFDAIVKAH